MQEKEFSERGRGPSVWEPCPGGRERKTNERTKQQIGVCATAYYE